MFERSLCSLANVVNFNEHYSIMLKMGVFPIWVSCFYHSRLELESINPLVTTAGNECQMFVGISGSLFSVKGALVILIQ